MTNRNNTVSHESNTAREGIIHNKAARSIVLTIISGVIVFRHVFIH